MAALAIHALSEDKAEAYEDVHRQIRGILAGESNLIARYASIAALLAQGFGERFLWTGFYLVDETRPPDLPGELIVGPYQGTLGCLRIPFGKGVCGDAAKQARTIIVADVHAYPGHITCDGRSNSEIVVPVLDLQGRLRAVLDIDSAQKNAFDAKDQAGLEAIVADIFGYA